MAAPASKHRALDIGMVDAVVALALMCGAAVLEWLNGRVSLCRCGRVRLWTGTVNGPENSQQVADWYSLSHVVHGLLLYLCSRLILPGTRMGRRLVLAVAAEAAWEVIENSPAIIDQYRATTIALGYTGGSILNSTGDIVFMMLGFILAARAPLWTSVAAGVLLEAVALLAIRDNLTLNIIMLIHPVAVIRAWQAA